MDKKPSMLIILDGFGYSKKRKYNAIYKAKSKIMQWFKEYPSCLLKASGKDVGLLEGMIGNSEVGHLTIGCGRIIKQPVTILNEKIKDGSFFKNQNLIKKLLKIKKNNRTLHLLGLLSDAGVHSHINHLFAILELAKNLNLKKIVVHPFLDGRDVPPKSAKKYLTKLSNYLKKIKIGEIGSIHGRFYSMDRDKNWNRTKKSYQVITDSKQIPKFKKWKDALTHYYDNQITDEFVPPTILNENANIKNKDAILFFNIREDRSRQLVESFLVDFNKFQTNRISPLWIITGKKYHPEFNFDVLYKKEIIKNTFFDVLEKAKKTIFTIAETEKYAHVTYFFNGGMEIKRKNETRIMIPSKSHENTYANIPKMSSPEITKIVINSLLNDPKDFYLINYANADMVGHSGNIKSTIKAIKCLDEELEKLYKIIIEELDGTLYIAADHGNAEDMFDTKVEQPRTAHTLNPVPFIMIKKKFHKRESLNLSKLSDVAPFILKNLGLKTPQEMLK